MARGLQGYPTMLGALDSRAVLTSAERGPYGPVEIAGLTDAAGLLLARLGLQPSDRILLAVPQGIDLLLSTLALAEHCLATPVDPALASSSIERIITEIRPAAMVVAQSRVEYARPRCRARGMALLSLHEAGTLYIEENGDPQARKEHHAGDAFPGLLLPTSGTTGEAKWVALQHHQLILSARGIANSLSLEQDDRLLGILPCHHIHGFSTVLAALLSGGSVVLESTYRPEALLDRVATERITWLSATPTHYRALLRAVESGAGRSPGDRLRLVRSASAPMDRRLVEELSTALAVPVIQAYGMTEAGPLIATNTTSRGGNLPGSVGRPIGLQVRIAPRMDVDPGTGIGEILIRGKSVAGDYWPPGSSEASDPDGWFRTGDLGCLDKDGFLFVTGRVRDIINTGGRKLLPAEIETTLLQHPAVAEAAVFPAPHDSLGEAPHAVLVLRDGFTVGDRALRFEAELCEAVRRFCVPRLAQYQVPHRLFVSESIPRNNAGKVQRQQLHERFARSVPQAPATSPGGETRDLTTVLRDLWAQGLRCADIGERDNFFALGGDSLSASQLILQLEECCGRPLEDDFVFLFPTIEQQVQQLAALAVETLPGSRETAALPALGKLLPLSPGQQRIYLLDRLGSGSEYNMSAPVWLRGELDRARFENALADLADRHDALRTRIRELDGKPVQYVEPHCSPALETRDLSHLPEKEREAAAHALAAEQRKPAFELSARPPLRYLLIRLAHDSHAFILTVHHIICDGWSVSILYRDLLLLYARHDRASGDSLPVITRGYEHYCRTAGAELTEEDTRRHLAWWKSRLQHVPSRIPLGRGYSLPEDTGSASARLHFSLGPATTGKLEQLARQVPASVFPLLMVALQISLRALSGQSRFCVGTAVANRRNSDYKNAVGFFANTLPIPAHVDTSAPLRDMLARVTGDCREALKHGAVDFGRIVQQLELPRRPGTDPLLQVMFAYQNFPSLASLLEGYGGPLQAEPFTADSDRAKFDLSLHLRPGGDELRGTWHYRERVFRDTDISHLQAVFTRVVEMIAGGFDGTVADLLQQLPTPADSPDPDEARPTLLDAIGHFARCRPTSIALQTAGVSLSYAQVLAHVECLAAGLAQRGVGPGVRVGVILPRNENAILTALALFARNATYVPMDCSYPLARMAYVASDAGIKAVVADERTAPMAGKLVDELEGTVEMIHLEDCRKEEGKPQHQAQKAPISDASAAYIIYTSGSTGKPKGVVINHGNLRHYIAAMSTALEVKPRDKWLHTASLSFSSSIRQFAVPLYSGASVYIARREDVLNVERIPQLVATAGLTVLDLVPSYWRNLLRASGLRRVDSSLPDSSSLRLILSASEPLPTDLAAELVAHFPTASLVNMYGQTETSGIALIEKAPVITAGVRYISLGKPITGIRVELRDSRDRKVSVGQPGEICIWGPTVGDGYITAAVDHVGRARSATADGGYRTGDLARMDTLGNIHYVGRADAQIKYRGFRIEPGDIETVALQYGRIEEVAVCLTASPGDPMERLHLFFSQNAHAPTDDDIIRGLRAHLQDQLPSHMIPTAYTRVESMPRTLSGKLDRAALSELAGPGGKPCKQVRNTDTLIAELSAIWKEVLSLEQVGPDDNFFDLGGDSLSSIEIVIMAEDAGIELSLEQLFRYQTIGQLVGVVGQSKTAPAVSGTASGEPVRYDVSSLREFGFEALLTAGLDEEGARIVTEVQLESSLRGQVTHNIGDIPRYATRLREGLLNGKPDFCVADTSPLSATVDGDNAPGQWVATVAMDKAIALAVDHGIGIVGVRRSNHFGAAGHYAWQAARSNMIGMCFTNGPVILAPTGGTTALFGNNPLAIGLPRGTADPVVLDIAMSVATRGKIGLTVAEGRPLQPGWILDKNGRPSTALEDLAAGLASPIGGHKGYGLAFAIEILSGALTGAGYCADHRREVSARHGGTDIGHLFLVIDPGLLGPGDAFLERVNDIVQQTRSSNRAAGVEQIFIPGEIEFRTRARNLSEGIPLSDSIVRRLQDYGRLHNLQHRIRAKRHNGSEDQR